VRSTRAPFSVMMAPMFLRLALAASLLALAGCQDETARKQAYQERVIHVLKGETLQGADDADLPDLAYSMGLTLEAMYCAEEPDCAFASEMEYFRQVAEVEAGYLGSYRQRICKDITPPPDLAEDGELVCASLEALHGELNQLERAARLARDFMRSARPDPRDSEAVAETRRSISGLIGQMRAGRERIRDALGDLKQIAWLGEINERLEAEVLADAP